ncbi:RagB/SusD family nutrient uptake outer membrane protein [Pedobacter sp. GR22-6]|uniref:RagB/SusD family nutrient uptake outer membrane protein n=1 Tax=Pedobacter sp. GR22-6 TaxID=3127957 RepID=UPI00307FC47D
MKKIIYNLTVFCLFTATLMSTGCEKLIEIDPPLNETSSTLAFATDNSAKSTIAGMFATLAQSAAQNINLTVQPSLQADDLRYLGVSTQPLEIMNNSYTRISSLSNDHWSTWYNIIYQANLIVIGLEKSSTVTPALKTRLIAEAKFVRAYSYFNLVNMFGDVPLILETDVTKTAFQPRETVANIYQQMLKDLTEAKSGLLPDYSASSGDRSGVNQFACSALLARVYLFVGRYADAEASASEVIASSLYKVVEAADMGTKVFIKNSTECIWQLSPPLTATNQYTAEAGTLLPSTYTVANIQYRISKDLTDRFALTDLRYLRWMNNVTIGTEVYSLPFKYKYRTNALALAANVAEQTLILRLAEQYLIRAEARARIGTNLSGARDDMNVIRSRAQAALSTSTVQNTLLEEIALENRKEFFVEQGFRWFNLKRTGQADAVIGAIKPTYKPTAKLLPIPMVATDANPNLTQNEGYL